MTDFFFLDGQFDGIIRAFNGLMCVGMAVFALWFVNSKAIHDGLVLKFGMMVFCLSNTIQAWTFFSFDGPLLFVYTSRGAAFRNIGILLVILAYLMEYNRGKKSKRLSKPHRV